LLGSNYGATLSFRDVNFVSLTADLLTSWSTMQSARLNLCNVAAVTNRQTDRQTDGQTDGWTWIIIAKAGPSAVIRVD